MLADLLGEILRLDEGEPATVETLLARAAALGLQLAPDQSLVLKTNREQNNESNTVKSANTEDSTTSQSDFSFNIARIISREPLVSEDNDSEYASFKPIDPHSPEVAKDNREIQCRAPPLLDQLSLQKTLQQHLISSTSGGQIDSKRLSWQLARLQSPAPMPRRQRIMQSNLCLALIDHCESLLGDLSVLAQLLQNLPSALRPEKIARATHTGWQTADQHDLSMAVLHRHWLKVYRNQSSKILVVGDPNNVSAVLRALFAQWQLNTTDCLWLCPVTRPGTLLWDKPLKTQPPAAAMDWLLALLTPCSLITTAMLRCLRRLLGVGVEYELAFIEQVQWYPKAGWGRVVGARDEHFHQLAALAKSDPNRVNHCISQLWLTLAEHPRFYQLEASIAWRSAAVQWAQAPAIEKQIQALDHYMGDIGASLRQAKNAGGGRSLAYAACVLQLVDRQWPGSQSHTLPKTLVDTLPLAQAHWVEHHPESIAMQGDNPMHGQRDALAAQLRFDSNRLWIAWLEAPSMQSANSQLPVNTAPLAGVIVCQVSIPKAGLVVEIEGKRRQLRPGESLPVTAPQQLKLYDATHRTKIDILDEAKLNWAGRVEQTNGAQKITTFDELELMTTIDGVQTIDKLSRWSPERLHIDDYGLQATTEIMGVEQSFRYIPPGEFTMGSPTDEPERDDDERQHQVTLTQGFWLAETACTQKLWQAVMGNNPSHFKGDNLPVEGVSWDDIQRFCEKLNALKHRNSRYQYCLPTEAEWEYACRAGTQTIFSFGNQLTTDLANYDGNHPYPYPHGPKGAFQEQTVDVHSFTPNPWGLYQMHGNVYEWCEDWLGEYVGGEAIDPTGPAAGGERVLRGGCWHAHGGRLRAAYRDANPPDLRSLIIGFRLAQAARPASQKKRK